nr:F0F1 ATP synthase subunit B [uncultured Carboxylicivirga sp.]
MGLLTPDPGLVFWTTITFGLLVFLLSKYAWKPIMHALKAREETIEFSLMAATKAKAEIEDLNIEKERILEEAKAERDSLIKEARDLKQNILDEAKGKAQEEADKILVNARELIEREKKEVIQEMRRQVAELSVNIAGKLLEQELESTDMQKAIIDKYLQEVNFN